MEIINRSNANDEVARLTAEVEKYKVMETELKNFFSDLQTALNIRLTEEIEISDLLPTVMKLATSKAKQKQLTDAFSKMKTIITHLQPTTPTTNGDNQ